LNHIYGDELGKAIQRALRGTTTVGIVLNDGVVLAADKRATAGIYVAHKRVKKIVRIDDRAAITTAGLVADAQALADFVRAQIHYHKISMGRPVSLRCIAYLLGLVLNNSKYSPYIVQLLLGGYDPYEGPKLFAIEYFGDVTEERYVATGSGSPIAIGVIESAYDPGMPIEQAVELAVKAIVAASYRDVFSGEGIDVVTITRDRYEERTFSISEIKKLLGRVPT